jgi:hypothetical protein
LSTSHFGGFSLANFAMMFYRDNFQMYHKGKSFVRFSIKKICPIF